MARVAITPGWLLLFALIMLTPSRAPAELQARPLSPSVVLVLKLVSQNRVQPTTGIVMSDEGLVMVPAEFLSPGDEIIVLDGGTDIIKNGRPAKLLERPGSNGWALLSVDGLKRPGITLSGNRLSTTSVLHLTAFPPAEYIANGLPPLWADVRVRPGSAGGQWQVSDETPLPYVTGPILDNCGHLVGVNLTSGVQSIDTEQAAVSLFSGKLRDTLSGLQLELPQAGCASLAEKGAANQPGADPKALLAGNQARPQSDPNLVKPEVYNPRIQRKRLNPFQGGVLPPQVIEHTPLWSRIPPWLLLAGLALLSLLVWKAWARLRKRKQAALGNLSFQSLQDPDPEPAAEPAGSAARIRSAPSEDELMPDMDALPPGCDGVLAVRVFAGGNTRLDRYRAVDHQDFDLVLGRSDCDINVPLPGIGNRHARLVKAGDEMTLSDLGSGNVTLINGIPCLPGEILFLESGDDLYLGDALLQVSIIRKDQASP